MIHHRVVLTTTNNDVLNGTILENIPMAGVLGILGASTAVDGLLDIQGRGFEVPVRQIPLPLRANGQPNQNEDPTVAFLVPAGGKVQVAYTENTAATAVLQFVLMDMAEAANA